MAGLGTFAFGATVEYLQHSGLDFLGNTYDPWDLCMYALGVGLGRGIDSLLMEQWKKSSGASSFSDGKLQ